METLVAATHHRNHHQSYGRNDSEVSTNIRGFNCRTFESGDGLLPNPFKAFSPPFYPKTPSPTDEKIGMCKSRSNPIPIKSLRERDGDFYFSERWAGPAYSNSPPPSSLPIPKFSMRPKRTVSLDLPTTVSEFGFHPISKSAPASPTREWSPSPDDMFDNTSSATKTLRRILNLDISDE